MKKCPRFHTCDVPKCPLDEDIDLRVKLPEDPKCTLPKSKRMKLGKDLPMRGMTKREFAGWRRWEEGMVSRKFKEQTVRVLDLGQKAFLSEF